MDNKGEFRGICYRTVCQNKPAIWFNHSTRKHYCTGCADLLNQENKRDAQQLYGHDLCTLVPFNREEEESPDPKERKPFPEQAQTAVGLILCEPQDDDDEIAGLCRLCNAEVTWDEAINAEYCLSCGNKIVL